MLAPTGFRFRGGYRYIVDPRLLNAIEKRSGLSRLTCVIDRKSGEIRILSRSDARKIKKANIPMLSRNGVFRIHGFQRKFSLKNFRLANDIEKWKQFARLLNRDNPPKNALEIVDIGYKGRGKLYIVKVKHEGRCYELHFRKNCIIITPSEEGIYVAWEDFDTTVNQILHRDIREIVSRALEIYNFIFKQKAYICKEKWIKEPEVAYIDPEGIIRATSKLLGKLHIEVLRAVIDRSEGGELDFKSVEDASNFKRTIDAFVKIAEFLERFDSVDDLINVLREYFDRKFDEIKSMLRKALNSSSQL